MGNKNVIAPCYSTDKISAVVMHAKASAENHRTLGQTTNALRLAVDAERELALGNGSCAVDKALLSLEYSLGSYHPTYKAVKAYMSC